MIHGSKYWAMKKQQIDRISVATMGVLRCMGRKTKKDEINMKILKLI